MVCPITNTDKSHPFHVNLDDSTSVKGVILADQAKMLNVRARDARFVEKCLEYIWMEATEIIKNFLLKRLLQNRLNLLYIVYVNY